VAGDESEGSPGVRVDVLTPAEWKILQKIRLEALRESPQAFLSNYDLEFRWAEDDWRRMLVNALWVVARQGRRTIGLACSNPDRDRPEVCHLESVWVTPPHRKLGVTRALVDFVKDIERRAGVVELLVWVLEGNHDARMVYERLGFRFTGERQPAPGQVNRYEERLRLPIVEGSLPESCPDSRRRPP